MFSLIKVIFNVTCDLLAALLICFGIVMTGFGLILWIIFMHTPVTDIILIAIAIAFVIWRLIRWFGW